MGALGEQVVRLSRGVRRLRSLFRDRAQTRVVVVTRAATLPRLETHRLLKALDRLGIHTTGVVVNAVTPSRTDCPRCRAARGAEAKEIGRLGCDIIVAPLALPPPRGVTRLTGWMRHWTRTTG
jgi:anion-transporting  ArsA/GET3 family ATPase